MIPQDIAMTQVTNHSGSNSSNAGKMVILFVVAVAVGAFLFRSRTVLIIDRTTRK